MEVPIKYGDKGAIVNVIETLDKDGLIICLGNYPLSATITVSKAEAADIAQRIMDVVSDHIQKAAA